MTTAVTQPLTIDRAESSKEVQQVRNYATSIKYVSTIDEILALRSDWDMLREQSTVISPNADIDRFVTTVKVLGEKAKPYVALLRIDGKARAMIVGRSQFRSGNFRIGYLRVPSPVLKSLDIVYGGVLSDSSEIAISEVTKHLRSLLVEKQFDQITINHLPLEEPLSQALNSDEEIKSRIDCSSINLHWQFELTRGSYDQTIARFSRKHRYNMRRTDRLLVEHFSGNVQLRKFDQPVQCDELVTGAAEIVSQTYQAGLGGFSDTPLHRELINLEAASGRLRSYWLECDGKPIAFQLGAVYANTYNLLSTAFLPQYKQLSPGQVLLVRVIQDLCEANIDSIDYGFGDAPYKRMYGSNNFEETTVYLYAKTSNAFVSRSIYKGITKINNYGSYICENVGLKKLIKKYWRARLSNATKTSKVVAK